jgi:shikimate 5-dehydrogenase
LLLLLTLLYATALALILTLLFHQQLTRVVRNLTDQRDEKAAAAEAANYADQCSSVVALRTEMATLRSDNTDLQKLCQAVTEQRDMYRRLHAEELHGYTGARSSGAGAGGSADAAAGAAAAAASKAEAVLKERMKELEQQLKSAEEKAAVLKQSEKSANDNMASHLTVIFSLMFSVSCSDQCV